MSVNRKRTEKQMVLKLELLDMAKAEAEQEKEDKMLYEEYRLIMEAWEKSYWEYQDRRDFGPTCEQAGCGVCQEDAYDPYEYEDYYLDDYYQ